MQNPLITQSELDATMKAFYELKFNERAANKMPNQQLLLGHAASDVDDHNSFYPFDLDDMNAEQSKTDSLFEIADEDDVFSIFASQKYDSPDSVKSHTQLLISTRDVLHKLYQSTNGSTVEKMLQNIIAIAIAKDGLKSRLLKPKTAKVKITIDYIDVIAATIGHVELWEELLKGSGFAVSQIAFQELFTKHRHTHLGKFIAKRTYAVDNITQDDFGHCSDISSISEIHLDEDAESLLTWMLAKDANTLELEVSDKFGEFLIDVKSLNLFFLNGSFTTECFDFFNQFGQPKSPLQSYKDLKATEEFLRKNAVNADCIIPGTKDCISASKQRRGKVAGIITLIGEAESGKTHCANAIFEAINHFMPNEYMKQKYELSQFVDKRDVSKLAGSGAQYVDSSLGEMTRAQEIYPYRVYICENPNLAVPEVQSYFTEILLNTSTLDFTTDREASFENCFFIFTINASKEALNGMSITDTNPTQLLFSPELDLDSRLAQALSGNAVITLPKLNGLQVNKLISMKLGA